MTFHGDAPSTKPNARVKTGSESKVVLQATNTHNHELSEQKLESKLLRAIAKRKANGDISSKPLKMIRNELQDFPRVVPPIKVC